MKLKVRAVAPDSENSSKQFHQRVHFITPGELDVFIFPLALSSYTQPSESRQGSLWKWTEHWISPVST